MFRFCICSVSAKIQLAVHHSQIASTLACAHPPPPFKINQGGEREEQGSLSKNQFHATNTSEDKLRVKYHFRVIHTLYYIINLENFRILSTNAL